jgi:hypothetical protein
MAEQAQQRHRYLRRKRGSPPAVADESGFAEAVAAAVEEEEARRSRLAARFETLAAAVLALAAVATAWSAYQSTRWNGDQAANYTQAGAYRTESVRVSNESDERTGVAVTLAADWLSAEISGNYVLADALRVRMPAELDAAMERWLAGWERGEAIPAGDPFTTGGFTTPESVRAAELEASAEAAFERGRQANQYSDNYVLTGVVFALSLFFAGVASRFGHPKNAVRMVYLAVACLIAGCILLLIQPKDVGI